MAVLDIRVLGDPILRERTAVLANITPQLQQFQQLQQLQPLPQLQQLAADMLETMYAAEGIGLAAPQVGRSERVFVADVDDHAYVMVNPEILEREGTERAEEGCLSIPEIFGDVDRASRVVVRALDVNGEQFQVEATGLLARCIQHELDHLDGKLFIDYLSLIKRKFLARRWEKEATNYPGFIRKLESGSPRKRRSRSRDASARTGDADSQTSNASASSVPFEPEL